MYLKMSTTFFFYNLKKLESIFVFFVTHCPEHHSF